MQCVTNMSLDFEPAITTECLVTENKIYTIFEGSPSIFSEAQSVCNGRDSSLVTISNKQEFDFIFNNITLDGRNTADGYYLGLQKFNRVVLNADFDFVTGNDPKDFFLQPQEEPWLRNQPNNIETNCVVWQFSDFPTVHGWNDLSCDLRRSFICEQDCIISIVKEEVLVLDLVIFYSGVFFLIVFLMSLILLIIAKIRLYKLFKTINSKYYSVYYT